MNIYWYKLLVVTVVVGFSFEATASPWVDDYQTGSSARDAHYKTHQKARLLLLDEASLRAEIRHRSGRMEEEHLAQQGLHRSRQQLISLPLANGSTITVNLIPSFILPEKLSKQFPNIKTYRVLPDDQVVNGRVDITPNGFHAMIQLRSGELFFIDPNGELDGHTNKREYVSYRKRDQIQSADVAYSCGAKQTELPGRDFSVTGNLQKPVTTLINPLLEYKIAIAATGEYVVKNGGAVGSALAAIATTLNRVNQVFEQDLGIHLSLVEHNDQIVYSNPDTDPFDARDSKDLLVQNQLTIDRVIGSENYDIGHLFTTKGGGLAAIGSVCNQYTKAKGVSGISNPENDSFNLDFVAHEISHQLGATHTFNSGEGLCSGGTRESRTAFEPGSGSTIMSYAGYCGVDNLQSNTDAMLHIGSIMQINKFTSNVRGGRCGVRIHVDNSPPVVEAGGDYIIPAQTPFELKGEAKDNDGDRLVYAWEQVDAGEASLTNDDKGDNALFRVNLPSSSKSRSFPKIRNVLDHIKERGEELPFQQRFLNFRFVAQDGYNGTQSDGVTVKVIRTGSRFALNMPRASYNRGEIQKILWNVANTDKAPINCSSVDISLSTNGGYDFDQRLLENIPNSGEAWITIPSDSRLSTNGRFKISCSDNIFFAISYRSFIIKDTADNISYFSPDEDLPEPNLHDRTLESGESVIDGKSLGGSFGYLLWLVLLLPLRRR